MEAILMVILLIFTLTGVFTYNSLRRKFAGMIGVGGSYVVLMGVTLLFSLPGSIAARIRGEELAASTGEIIMVIAVMLLCLAYTAYVIIARCQTTAQKILLPFAACMIGAGFCWKLLAAIFFHVPMENGKSDAAVYNFPQTLADPQGNLYALTNEGGDTAQYYCHKTNQYVTFHTSDFDNGNPVAAGWGRR